MKELAGLTVDELLDRLAERTPTPGGGSATGLAGAVACAMARMVAAYSARDGLDEASRAVIEDAEGRLRCVDQIQRALITRDAVAYANMGSAAKARSQKEGSQVERDARYQQAVVAAAAVPMEMAAAASTALSAMDGFKGHANRRLLSDLAIAAVLADATARCARLTVYTNAREIADPGLREKLKTNVDRTMLHCAARLASVEAFVQSHMEEPA